MPDRTNRVVVALGTRPEAIKLAPVIRELRRSSRFETVVCATGQHREMLDQVLDVFAIRPDHDLNLMQHDQALPDLMANVLRGMAALLASIAPDLLIVQGDTTTTLAAALAGFYARIPVAHVEAGLRSDDITAPWPEEMNRRAVTVLSSAHLAPTDRARSCLLQEGVSAHDICTTGNTVIDALLIAARELDANASLRRALDARFSALDAGRRLILVTSRRRESWGPGLDHICGAIARIADSEDVDVVYALHRNPNARASALRILAARPRVHVLDPLSYLEFVYLLRRCHFVVTDSGGIQEEAPALAKPVLVVRDTTERPEGIDAGVARLVGTGEADIVQAITELLGSETSYRSMARSAHPYGDGRGAERAAAFLTAWLDRTGTDRKVSHYTELTRVNPCTVSSRRRRPRTAIQNV